MKMQETYMSMPDKNKYLDDDHEIFAEDLGEWAAKNYSNILRAVNSHDDLVGFVERFVRDMNNTEAHNCEVVTEARALITKAKAAS